MHELGKARRIAREDLRGDVIAEVGLGLQVSAAEVVEQCDAQTRLGPWKRRN